MFFIWVIVAALLQVTVLKELNLLVILVIFSGLRKGPFRGLLIGGIIGIIAEVFCSSVFGLNLALYAMLGLVSGIAKSHIYYKKGIFMEFMFTFCGVALFYSAYFILSCMGRLNAPQSLSVQYIFFTALFSAALSPIVFRIVGK